jgi:endonuclease I
LPKSQYGGQVNNWNREHTWPKSHGFPQAGWPAYTDVHHLRPSLVTVNTARGILDFDNGGYKVLPEAPLVKYDDDSWEVPNEVKGDIARGLFYMAVRYEGGVDNEPDLEITDNVNESQPNSVKIGKLSTLLEWHLQDPPNEQEQLRNDKIFRWQGNRNPFIDHPEWVIDIWETELIINNGMGLNANQQQVSTTAHFAPMISLKNEQKSADSVSITQIDTITIKMNIEVDEVHLNKMAALLILVNFKNEDIEQWYMRNNQTWQIWDGNFFSMANVAAELRMALSEVESLVVFEGNFQGMPGGFTIYVGYALPEGLIIFNGKKPFQLSVQ